MKSPHGYWFLFALLVSGSQAATVFFSQAVDASGTSSGGLSGTTTLPIYAPIRDTPDGQVLGFVEVTLGSQSTGGQNLTYPRTDGTDSYIYQAVNGGIDAFTSVNFRFVASDGTLVPLPSTTIGVAELYIRVDGRGLTTGGGFVTIDETNTLTLASEESSLWEVTSDLGIIDDSSSGGTLTYTTTGSMSDPDEFIQWRAFDPEGDDSITGLTWRLDNNGGNLNATHLQLDLAPIPEPSSILLAGAGLSALLFSRRRHRGA